MKEKIFYSVGTIIKFENKKYVVEESDSCNNCAFWLKDKNRCGCSGTPLTWACSRFARIDFKDVIFRFAGWALSCKHT